ncbi:MAG: hypothetical protein GY795_32080 [Desulfobacterales bacterium]|nr:hypothetical protein [Desulfobacterales bacterium]
MKKIALSDAFRLWELATPTGENEHLKETDFISILEGRENNVIYNHLALCKICRQRLWEFQKTSGSLQTADDYVLPLAASSGNPAETSWITSDKKYQIELLKILSKGIEGSVLQVRVLQPFDFEGKSIAVMDENGRELLRGKIGADGELATIIEDVGNVNLNRIEIKEVKE